MIAAFHRSWLSAAGEIAYAQAVARRLPVTFAALAAGIGSAAGAQTGGRCTLTTAERPPRTMASASLSTWDRSPGSDTVTP